MRQVFVLQHPHAGPVLLLARHGLQAQGLQAAAGHAAGARQGAWSTCCRCGRRRDHYGDHAAARGRGDLGYDMYVMFATSNGTVRRNRLSDFTHVMANGKIAMKLERTARGPGWSRVRTCDERRRRPAGHRQGQVHPFPGHRRARLRWAATLSGVRGIKLAKDDDGNLHVDPAPQRGASAEERDAYLRYANAASAGRERGLERRGGGWPRARRDRAQPRNASRRSKRREQFILSVADDGLGKRTSAYEYRVAGRGGQGIDNSGPGAAARRRPRAAVVAAFPVDDERPAGAGDRRRQADPLRRCTISASPAGRPAGSSCSDVAEGRARGLRDRPGGRVGRESENGEREDRRANGALPTERRRERGTSRAAYGGR